MIKLRKWMTWKWQQKWVAESKEKQWEPKPETLKKGDRRIRGKKTNQNRTNDEAKEIKDKNKQETQNQRQGTKKNRDRYLCEDERNGQAHQFVERPSSKITKQNSQERYCKCNENFRSRIQIEEEQLKSHQANRTVQTRETLDIAAQKITTHNVRRRRGTMSEGEEGRWERWEYIIKMNENGFELSFVDSFTLTVSRGRRREESNEMQKRTFEEIIAAKEWMKWRRWWSWRACATE